MIERDDELSRLLRQWGAPAPDPLLDKRVRAAFRETKRYSGRRWLSVAAGIVLLGALFLHLMRPHPEVARSTVADAGGLKAMPDGEITIEKGTQ